MFARSKRVALYATGLTLCGGGLLAMCWRPVGPPSNQAEQPLSNPDGFDATRAFADLEHLVAFGPRPAGSQNLDRARQWIIDQLGQAGVTAQEDSFVAPTPLGPIPMTNIVGKIPGASPSIVIVGGHYDTKRTATPFVGANDGGSSAAFLLEMARVLAHRRNKLTYSVVFFDGEEAVQRWSATDSLYGSRHLAAKVAANGAQTQVKAMILVDMVADAALDIQRDTNSTRWLQDLVFNQAHRLGYGRYFSDGSKTIEDDHIPFVEIGIPAVDIIDLDYGPLNLYWHTRYDTVPRCSSASLNTVGHVVLATLAAVEASTHNSTIPVKRRCNDSKYGIGYHGERPGYDPEGRLRAPRVEAGGPGEALPPP